jgi:hypothetical protein
MDIKNQIIEALEDATGVKNPDVGFSARKRGSNLMVLIK